MFGPPQVKIFSVSNMSTHSLEHQFVSRKWIMFPPQFRFQMLNLLQNTIVILDKSYSHVKEFRRPHSSQRHENMITPNTITVTPLELAGLMWIRNEWFLCLLMFHVYRMKYTYISVFYYICWSQMHIFSVKCISECHMQAVVRCTI